MTGRTRNRGRRAVLGAAGVAVAVLALAVGAGVQPTAARASGAPAVAPITGDWNGDGTTTIGVVDPTTATWYLRNANGAGPPDVAPFTFGAPGWIPVTGDWNGDGTTTIGVVDPTTMTWYLRNANGAGPPDVAPFVFSEGPTKAPQSIAFSSSPPASAVYGGSYSPSASGGGSGNAVVFSIDGSSGAGVCSIAGDTISFTGVGSCVIDANQAGNANYDAAPQAQQTLSIGKATLTVIADDQSNEFGAAVPTLTWKFSGFAFGETLATSDVTGAPSCTTTAGATSPAGTYPITCTQGSLASSHYAFTFVDGTLTVTVTETMTGSHSGRLTITPGEAVLLGSGATVSGPLTVQPGGALEIDGAHVTGPVRASEAAEIRVCGATITGPTEIIGSSGLIRFGNNGGTPSCAGNTFTGPVRITGNSGPVIFDHNTVAAPLTISGNTGIVEALANTISGKSTIQR